MGDTDEAEKKGFLVRGKYYKIIDITKGAPGPLGSSLQKRNENQKQDLLIISEAGVHWWVNGECFINDRALKKRNLPGWF